eukprot:4212600-Alexandrium_andersonii.AAC.1
MEGSCFGFPSGGGGGGGGGAAPLAEPVAEVGADEPVNAHRARARLLDVALLQHPHQLLARAAR